MKLSARLVCGALIALASCTPKKDDAHTTGDAPASSSAAASPASAPASAVTSASARVDVARPPCPLAGAWEGKYEAKKAAVTIPLGQRDVVRASDDGKTAIGAGTIAIKIASDGEITGTIDGALGPGSISGSADESGVRAAIAPNDPSATSMNGVLLATEKDGALKGELRASGPDAAIVRTAAIELRKK